MKRNILLLEPDYKNKYPPIGLMKLASYYKKLGDNVTFYKGDLKTLVLNDIYFELEKKLLKIDATVNWYEKKELIFKYLKTSRKLFLDIILAEVNDNKPLILKSLVYYKQYYRNKDYAKKPKYDRVCIATLFTFYWKKTIETIEFAKLLVKDNSNILIGGVMASLLPNEIKNETGLKVYEGLLDRPGILDNNSFIVDQMPLDYSILDEIDYTYPESNGYYGYMTRGCTRKCAFCAVPAIEPTYKSYISLENNTKHIDELYGQQRNLLLLDNNVLASKEFPRIIKEIINLGFTKGAKYIEPNLFELSIRNLKKSVNDTAYIKKSFYLLKKMLSRLKGKNEQIFYDKLDEFELLNIETTSKDNLIKVYPYVKELYEKFRNKVPKARYVDFNQGVDALYVTEEKIKLLSQIPIRPLRIAFDNIKIYKKYTEAIRLAAKYNINHLSNYLLYNYEDKPVDLYQRMKINIDLCEELGVSIYSFPMKYIPLFGEASKDRTYVGKYWNKKFIRAVQAVLNSTKGKIGRGKSFFKKAFGEDEDEFNKILYMPEPFIIYRLYFEENKSTYNWWQDFQCLSKKDKAIIEPIIGNNRFLDINMEAYNDKIKKVLAYYLIKREDYENSVNK